MKRPDRITRLVFVLAVLALAVGAACSNKKEIRAAKGSVYDADFAIVYSEVVAAVRELYPNLDEDPATGLVKTAWHQVQYSTGAEDPRSTQSRDPALGNDPNNLGTGGAGTSGFGTPAGGAYKRLFIRFDIAVTGGRPWRVRIVGKASEWDPGNAQPTELRGAATPHWLPGRRDGLYVAIYRRLRKYAIQMEVEEEAPDEPEAVAVDPTLFGDIPSGAAKAATTIVEAIDSRDMKKLRAALADDVVWSLGASGDAEAALAMWQADPGALDSLSMILYAGCRKDAKDPQIVTCPPQATEEPGYLGWRATLQLDGEVWRLTAFVQGD
jgi:hypothetical protein